MSYNKYLQEQKVKELVNGILGEEIDCSQYQDEKLEKCEIASMRDEVDELIKMVRDASEEERTEINLQIKMMVKQIELMELGMRMGTE